MKTACQTQCPQCPFRPDSLPSYLGDYTAESIISALWHNQPFFCHTRINYSNPGWEKVAKERGKLCAGSMVMAHKIGAPLARIEDDHDPEVIEARLVNQARKDVVCMEPKAFQAHHNPANVMKTLKKIAKPKAAKKVALKPLPQLKGKPTDADIQTEIARLKELLPLNVRSLNDQIWVLETRASENAIWDQFDLITEDQEPDEDDRAIANESEGRSFERASNAGEARSWVTGDSTERPSDGWLTLVQ